MAIPRPLRLALLSLCLGAPAAAQPPTGADTLPFRAGQWAAQFWISDAVGGVGALRFRSPSRAWVLDAAFTVADDEQVAGDVPPPPYAYSTTAFYVRGQLGQRAYRMVAKQSAAYAGVGAIASYQGLTYRPNGAEQYGWNAGAYAELGAAYLVTPHLSLGASVSIDGTYGRTRRRDPPPTESTFRARHWRASMTPPRLTATLYF